MSLTCLKYSKEHQSGENRNLWPTKYNNISIFFPSKLACFYSEKLLPQKTKQQFKVIKVHPFTP